MLNILVILLFCCFIRSENKLWEDAKPCNLMIINNRGNHCRKWKAAYPMGEYRLHTQRSSIVRLLTASAFWNLCTNGSFKMRGGDIGYPWPLSQGLWVRRHQKIPKISTKICQKQNTQAMLEFALARRSPFYDVWAHTFSCWIAGGKSNAKKLLWGYFLKVKFNFFQKSSLPSHWTLP